MPDFIGSTAEVAKIGSSIEDIRSRLIQKIQSLPMDKLSKIEAFLQKL